MIERITEQAKAKGESPTKAMVAAGVGKDFFYNIRNGKKPSAEKVEKFSTYLKVSTDFLLGLTDDPTPGPALDLDNSIKFALFGDTEIDDDVMDEVKAYAKFVAERKKKEKKDDNA